MRKPLILMMSLLAVNAAAQRTISVTVTNNSGLPKTSEPVVISLKDMGVDVKSAFVDVDEQETACQLDDIDRDGHFDELCFLADVDGKSTKTFIVTLYDKGTPQQYESKVYAELMLRNNKIKAKNKQDLYISELTVNKGVNPYQSVNHHGVAFENELLCMRIYFDHRQTVDLYGKYHKRLELKETQFYPDEEQKKAGYGDDILFVGSSYGLGALRGWNGKAQTMLTDVDRRSQRIIASGPLRAIVEIEDFGWTPQPGMKPINMKTHYTLYAGHRDCMVRVMFSQPVDSCHFATGLVNVGGNSAEYSDGDGLRGCWGTAWPVALKDTTGHKRETVGLGILVPQQCLASEEKATPDEYTYVVRPSSCGEINYRITYSSDNESFGYHSKDDWFKFLREWKEYISHPIEVSIKFQ